MNAASRTATHPSPVRIDFGDLAEQAFDAVIFDMDGTLIDSTPAVNRSWQTWAAEHQVTTEQLLHHHGQPSAQVVRALLPEHRHPAGIARIDELELADVEGIVVLPGAAEALAAVTGDRTAIATSCTAPLAAARIAAAELTAPSVLVTADDVARGKPAPDPFLEAARRLEVEPARCLVVEDAPAGLAAARAAGCRALAVITTTAAEHLDADGIVGTLADVRFTVSDDGRVRVALREPS